MTPLLSVVVPAYNVAEYLPDCLDSLLAQTLSDIEVVVVIDGSPDECGEIADDFASRDPRVTALHLANQGVGPARNSGVEVATGKYLAFTDSDDLVPPRAFELMVSTLERTGSDFVAGNAWRYLPGQGNVPSWTHRQAFAEDRLRTNIREFPLLMRDRMPWNKVFRRSFWDAHRFNFPAMRYEDFPVVLAAHFAATSVDVLSTRVYMWRQRESNTSITQRSADLGNATDRVRSAEMVLDLADEAGDVQVRDALHAYLVDVDMVAIAEAYAQSDLDHREDFAALVTTLAQRLRPRAGTTTRLAALIHRAARRGDLETMRAMAAWRRDGDKRALLRSVLRPSTAPIVPALIGAVTPRRRRLKVRNRRLRTQTRSITVEAGDLVIDAEIKLRSDVLRRATVWAELVNGKKHRLPASVEHSAGIGWVARLRIPIMEAAGWLGPSEAHLRICVQLGPITWRGPVPTEVELLPPPAQVGDGGWLVASLSNVGGEHLWLSRMSHIVVGQVEFTADGLRVRLPGVTSGFVGLLRTMPSAPLLCEVVDGTAELTWDEVAADDPADDPSSGESLRPLVYISSGSRAEAVREAKAVSPAEEVEEAVVSGQEKLLAKEAERIDESVSLSAEESGADTHRPAGERRVGEGLVWPVFTASTPVAVNHGMHQFRPGRTRLGAFELVMQLRAFVEERAR